MVTNPLLSPGPWQFWPAPIFVLFDDIARTLLWIAAIVYFCERFKEPLTTFIANLRHIGTPFGSVSTDKRQPVEPPTPPAVTAAAAGAAQDEAITRAWLHERTYNAIYGSQTAMLVMLEYQTVDTAGARYFYDLSVKAGNPSASFDAYMAFLINWQLVSVAPSGSDVVYSITDRGRDFLNYLKTMGLSLNRPW